MIPDQFHHEPPREDEVILAISRKLNLPGDYIAWMRQSNGGEGNLGNLYLSFWPLEEMENLNQEFHIPQYLGSGALCFATDGGGIGYFFKALPEDFSVWSIPLGDLDWAVAKKIGDDFGSALRNAVDSLGSAQVRASQNQKCKHFGSPAVYPEPHSRIGVALQTKGKQPINGMRAFPDDGFAGWYIWAGDYSSDDDFFQPVHISHLPVIWPELLPYLALAPDYRFIMDDDGYEDVWNEPVIIAK